ncbi:MAG: ADP-glyceromanno-heptose 6-epimerase [Candidatus Omnitrophota bacterium]|nr:MAG: ADP-glyceromanno-heptose 6-epimerase [Candidatus Omnitrophota bacterium]
MKILVTGGAGFIGSNVVKILEDRGADTIILDDFSGANYKNLDNVKGEVICADILDESLYKKLPQVDAVIHQAAITNTTLKDNNKMINVNFNGFKNVLQFCLNKNIKLVYISSAGVYGNGISPMKEEQKASPHNSYAYSKYLCDWYAQKVRKELNASLIVGLRYFNVYGPGESHKSIAASMIYHLFLQMEAGKRPRVFKYGQQRRDFIYVKDAARITVEALEFRESLVLNVGTGTARSFNDIIAILNKALNKNLEPDYFDNPYEGIYQDYTEADVSLLKEMNAGAQFSLEEGIGDYVDNYLLCGAVKRFQKSA